MSRTLHRFAHAIHPSAHKCTHPWMHPCCSLQKTWRLAFPEPRTPSMRSSKLHLIRACSTNLHSCHGSLIRWPNVMCTVSWQKLHPNMGGRHVDASTARFLRDCFVVHRPSAGFHSPHALHMLRQALPGFFVIVVWCMDRLLGFTVHMPCIC